MAGNSNAADPGSGDPAGGGSSTTGQPGSTLDMNKPLEEQVAEWQKRFGGLQNRFKQEQTALLNANAKVMDVETQLTELMGQKEALSLTNTQLSTELTAAQKKAAELEAAHARTQLIALEFPHLLPFEKDGLLPAGAGDELKTKLTAFTARIGNQTAAAAQTAAEQARAAAAAAASGTTPPTPGGAPASYANLMSQLIAARGTPEYAKLAAELVKLQPPDPTLAVNERPAGA